MSADGRNWQGLIDTNEPEARLSVFAFGEIYAVTGRSMLVLGLTSQGSTTRRLYQGLGAILEIAEGPLSD